MGKKVTITLTVSAKSLYDMASPTQAQIDSHCTLSDDNAGNSPDDKIEDFTSNVYINQDVEWDGDTEYPTGVDSGYGVDIMSIVYEPNVDDDVNFFDSGTLSGNGGKVKAKVKNDSNLVDKIDVYTINFRIDPPGNGTKKDYKIDPKLKGNS